MAIVWDNSRIHHEISLSRNRICANRSGSWQIEFSSHSFGSAAEPSSFFGRGANSQRQATSVSSQKATTSGRQRRIKWEMAQPR
jgi:hypothetical protein